MAQRLSKNAERKVPKSFSIEESIMDDFVDNCANHLDITASKKIRNDIIKFNKECAKKDAKEKKVKKDVKK